MNLSELPTHPQAADLQACLLAQRAAFQAAPMPTLEERLADLDTLERFVREQQTALAAAISADYGHRSHHETLITEIAPVLASLRHARA